MANPSTEVRTESSTKLSEVTDLVRRARAGDREAFGDLAEQSWSGLVTLARGLLAEDAAEDVVQEALIHAWRRLSTLRRPESFQAWVRRIVTRRCLTRARGHLPFQLTGTTMAAIRSTSLSAADGKIDVAALLSLLSPRQRAAVYLSWIEGCTDAEAARLLGLRPATVRVHRFRGLHRLRQLVGRIEND